MIETEAKVLSTEILDQAASQLTQVQAEDLIGHPIKVNILTEEDKKRMWEEFTGRPDILMRIAMWDSHHRREGRPYPPPPIIFSERDNCWAWVTRKDRRGR